MGELFGLSQQDIEKVSSWLQSQGLHVNWVSPGRTFIGFNGTAADVGNAFHTQVNYYKVNGAAAHVGFVAAHDPRSAGSGGQSGTRPLHDR